MKTRVNTFRDAGVLLDVIAQAIYDNTHGLVTDDATTDDITAVMTSKAFRKEVYERLVAIDIKDLKSKPAYDDEGIGLLLEEVLERYDLELSEWSVDMSAHRPPYVEFYRKNCPALAGVFECGVWSGYELTKGLLDPAKESKLYDELRELMNQFTGMDK